MMPTIVQVRSRFESFLSDEEGGERDTLTTLLILALVIVPLILVILAFGEKLIEVAQTAWDEVMGSGLTP